ncbi:MAG: hypothetical protein Q7T82_20905 [Armatimonadota bacterium]|nr:hypothetical protein [Armatimonadota bacterium]
MAGLKHMDVVPGQADQACGEIRRMTADEVEKTLSFILSLVAGRRQGETRTGKPERLLLHLNKWSFNEGERAKLLEELARMRRGARP